MSTIDHDTHELVVDEDEIPFEGADDKPGELVVANNGNDIVTLFGTGGPEMVLAKVEQYATAIKDFIVAHDLALEMEDGTQYPVAEAWEGLGQMMGVYAVVESTEQLQGGWKARAFTHRHGERLTAREAVCMRAEPGKNYDSESAIQGMAETRACRKALKSALNLVVNAAGYTTPADEKSMSPKSRAMLFACLTRIEQLKPRGGKNASGWKDWVTAATMKRYGKRISGLNQREANEVITGMLRLEEELKEQVEGGTVDDFQPSEDELAEAQGFDF